MNETIEDPVCHIRVPSTSFATKFAGGHYAFCSERCKERFLAHPHLYIGCCGQKAPAQQGKKVIKRHRLLLTKSLDTMQTENVKRALLEMKGMHDVCIEGDKIEIQYDLIQATLDQITDQLALTGAGFGDDWLDRLKLAFINNMEEIEISSLEVTCPTKFGQI